MANESDSPDERAKHVWSIGSYADVAPDFLGMAATLVDATGPREGDDVLDVACGTGNVAITAARRGARVTGLDLVPAMLEDARANAEVAGFGDVEWREGSATALPFEDDTFDVTLSCVGHVFADPPEAAGRELTRVTRPGGRIGFTAWRPTAVVAAMGDVFADYLPEDPDAPEPPALWGDPDVVRENGRRRDRPPVRNRDGLDAGTVTPHYWEMAITESGLFIVALEAVDEDDRPTLREEVVDAVADFFDEEQNAVRMDYRLATATVS